MLLVGSATAGAQEKQLDPVVVSASRTEQKSFDAAASIDAVPVEGFRMGSPLVNMSELLSAVPGIQVRERQNYAQDLQISIRGFGTRSTFGVRGVRILVDGIPATMPDGQGQASTASLTSARQIEVLRGPVAQLYGNAAGGVVQVFTADPPLAPAAPYASASIGAGSYGQRQAGVTVAGGGEQIGALLDVSRFETDGYRDHSAARRTQVNGKVLWKPSPDTTVTGIVNSFDQPLSQDPLGLSRADFERNPRGVVAEALTFDTRKTVEQHQGGILLQHRVTQHDTVNARLYAGTRKVFQTLAMRGDVTATAPTASGGVVDLDNHYRGAGISWTHAGKLNGMPVTGTIGAEADSLDQARKGYVNDNGRPGAVRRDEKDSADNVDLFGQVDWMFHQQWKATAGVRSSRVRLSIDDAYIVPGNPDDSGRVEYRNNSPVAGLVWYARDNFNIYGNIGRGFETPALSEVAYRPDGTGTNLGLRPSRSLQQEIGMKWRGARQSVDVAVFNARSEDEIVPQTTLGRATFQNVDEVQRRGIETNWKAEAGKLGVQVAYTLLDARFRESYVSRRGTTATVVPAGNRLPGTPRHSLFTQFEYRILPATTAALEMRAESKVYANDVNTVTAPGYAVFNLRAGQEFQVGRAKAYLFGRLDNLFDRNYAGSVIVNEGNQRFFEPAAGRRVFVGLRAAL